MLHVPSLAVNLLSFTKLCRDNHCYIVMDDLNICVQDKESKALLYQGKSNDDGLFLFKSAKRISKNPQSPTAFVGSAVKSSLWHQRLGRPTAQVV